MHALAVVMVPFDVSRANLRPIAARDAALTACMETLLFRYQQPDDGPMWGVDMDRGFQYDWYAVGGRWANWGRQVRKLMKGRRLRPCRRSIPRAIERDAVWSEDLVQLRLTSWALLPIAVITPHGEWEQSRGNWGWSKSNARERKSKAAWIERLRTLMRAYPSCLVIAIDFHF
jgi:hypothetical protein